MNHINNNFSVKFDNMCDYIPFVSTLSNLTDLFMKSIYLKNVGVPRDPQGYYFTHLRQKSFTRMAILLIPIFGNLCIGIHDFVNKERNKTLDAVRRNGLNLEFASSEFQDDEEIVREAVRYSALVLQYASPRLQNDETTVLLAVKSQGDALQYASERLKDEFSIVQPAVMSNHGCSLRFASLRLRDDEMMVWQAVKSDGAALEFASERLQDNETIVRSALYTNCYAIKFASPRVRSLILSSQNKNV